MPNSLPKSQTFLTWIILGTTLAVIPGCEQQPSKPLANAPDADIELLKGNDAVEGGIEHTSGRFLETLEQLEGVVIVDFWGPHCPSCRQLDPELEKVARARPKSVSIVKVDAEASQNAELVRFFGIRVVPRMLVFQDGKPIGRIQGYLSASQILNRLTKAIKAVEIAAAE